MGIRAKGTKTGGTSTASQGIARQKVLFINLKPEKESLPNFRKASFCSQVTTTYLENLFFKNFIRYFTSKVAKKLEIPPTVPKTKVLMRSCCWILTKIVIKVPKAVLTFVELSTKFIAFTHHLARRFGLLRQQFRLQLLNILQPLL